MGEKIDKKLRIDDTGFGGIRIIQNPDAFCYGIDAVLLAASLGNAGIGPSSKIADLGTGNGIIPLILSHKTRACRITGVELMQPNWELACRNVKINNLEDRLDMINCNVKDVNKYLSPGSYDAVVSNPPYMAGGTGMKGAGGLKSAARHETDGGLEDFIKAGAYLLKDGGWFHMVHRPHRLTDIMYFARKHRLEPKSLQFICPHSGEKPNILLIKCRKFGGRELSVEPDINVYSEEGTYTEEILKIYERI